MSQQQNNQQNNQQNQQQNQQQSPSRRFGSSNSGGSRLSSRFGNNQQNQQQNNQQNQQQNNPPARPFSPPRPNPFGNRNNNQRNWTMQPLSRTVVRFELKGLGDPFFRMLGHEINPDYGDIKTLTRALNQGGEHVETIKQMLDKSWETLGIDGAILVYNWNREAWKTIAQPPANKQDNDDNDDDDLELDDSFSDDDGGSNKPRFTCLRSIDLSLALNVLARSRSQLLIARAPLVFGQDYLFRSIMSDDPRLISLVKATGYIEEQ